MKIAKLLHNPGAGDEEHDKNELMQLIEAAGYQCYYASTKKKGWEEIEPDVDFIIVAGGDGTVRKVVTELLERRLLDKHYPIAVLPLGTANNIARSIYAPERELEEIIRSWADCRLKKFDIGRVTGVEDHHFFLEGMGFGLFPKLMRVMEPHDEQLEDEPEARIRKALEELMKLARGYEAKYCKLIIDGEDYSGDYLMVAVMNNQFIGPNLHLNPQGDHGDGCLEVIRVAEDQREAFANFVQGRLQGRDEPYVPGALQARKLELQWAGKQLHIDDALLPNDKKSVIEIEVQSGVIEFLWWDEEAG